MIILYIVILYLLAGLAFSVTFLVRWIDLIDEGAQDTGLAFKLTILPGCIVFWPVLLKKYIRSKSEKYG